MKNLILSGGGIRGFMQLGSLKALDKFKLLNNIKNYAGSSAGSVLAFMLSINYKYNDIFYIFLKIDTFDFLEEDLFKFFSTYALFNLNKVETLLKNLLYLKFKKKKITYIELYNLTKNTLHITALNITTHTCSTFNYINTPDINVIDSIIASCSIPFIYPPKNINNIYYIDCLIFNDYPTYIFKKNLKNTIGIYTTDSLMENVLNSKNNLEDFYTYMFNLYILIRKFLKNKIVDIPKINIKLETTYNAVNYNLTKSDILILFNDGYNNTYQYIENYKKKNVFTVFKYYKIYLFKLWYKYYLKLLCSLF